jgi:hypothetical protein
VNLNEEGSRIGQISFKLFERFNHRSFLARFYAAYYVSVFTRTNAAQECLHPLRFASKVGKETGDIEFSMVSEDSSLWESVPLSHVLRRPLCRYVAVMLFYLRLNTNLYCKQSVV